MSPVRPFADRAPADCSGCTVIRSTFVSLFSYYYILNNVFYTTAHSKCFYLTSVSASIIIQPKLLPNNIRQLRQHLENFTIMSGNLSCLD